MKKQAVTCPSVAGLCAMTVLSVLAATAFLLYHQDQALVSGLQQRGEGFAQQLAATRALMQEDPAALQQVLDRLVPAPHLASVEIADATGRIIAATDRGTIGRLLDGPEWNGVKASHVPSVFSASGEQGELMTILFSPISEGPRLVGWSRMTLVMPFKERLEPAIRTAGAMLVLLVMLLVAIVRHHARMKAAVDDIQEQVRTIVQQVTGVKDEAA
ncbi:MAG TPA: PDC sensor domain-containing protein [Nitrospiraceae bacterium]|nr:PDC sensor domain-containing protein [Nitrospiraceae bacterium]